MVALDLRCREHFKGSLAGARLLGQQQRAPLEERFVQLHSTAQQRLVGGELLPDSAIPQQRIAVSDSSVIALACLTGSWVVQHHNTS